MCGRFSLSTPLPDLASRFEADASGVEPRDPRYNVAPTESVIVLRPGASGRELAAVRWGLIPHWAEDPASLPLMINARSESLAQRRAFRDLIAGHRCAVLADGFYEWRSEGGLKQPYFVRRRDRSPMALAGLWDAWRGRGRVVESCTIVTTAANELLHRLHDRMPAILDEEGAQLWLDPEMRGSTPDLRTPFEGAELEIVPVSRRVSRVEADDPGCIEPLDEPVRDLEGWARRPAPGSTPTEQLGFFTS